MIPLNSHYGKDGDATSIDRSKVMENQTLTMVDTTSLFLNACNSLSEQSTHPQQPNSVSLLTRGATLPPIPPHVPQCKVIPSTRFIIDGFRLAGDHSVSYFLSHFHSDHYAGLTPAWRKGIVFCSEITSRLLVESLKVPAFFVSSLSLGETVCIDGCEVCLVDANHCPGAVQFLFKIPQRKNGEGFKKYVHTGDFRFHESMKLDPPLSGFVGSDAVFLDTTYCNPKFVFPPQLESIEYVASTIERIMEKGRGKSERILFLIATYVVGKERILVEVSRRCNCVLHVDRKKMRVLRAFGYDDSDVFTTDMSYSDVHVIGWNLLGESWPYFRPNFVKMDEIMRERGYTKAVAFVPTGWMNKREKDGFDVRVKNSLEIHLVPYSEHSSYDELRKYIAFLKPKHVIPTVGLDVDKLDSKHVIAMQRHFASLVDGTAIKHEFLSGFQRNVMKFGENEGNDPTFINSDQGSDNIKQELDERMTIIHTPTTTSEDKDSQLDVCLQNTSISDKDIEETFEELRCSLPSWVTEAQIAVLLTFSGGDIVEAVSEFYEHETELFEEANCCITPVFHTSSSNNNIICSNLSSPTANHERSVKHVLVDKKLSNRSASISKRNLSKKRGSTSGSKIKRKGNIPATSISSGCKQSTITKFFQKL